MNETPSDPGWDDLARELGADPPPEAFQRHQPSVPAPPSSVAEKSSPVELPKPVASDWNSLADSLGLEVVPEESASSETLQSTSGSDVTDDTLDSDLESDLEDGVSGEEARDAFEALFEDGPPAEDGSAVVDADSSVAKEELSEIEFTEIPSAEISEPTEATEEQEAGPPKKRRRPRRRGRGRQRGEKPVEDPGPAIPEQMVSGQEAAAAITRDDLIDRTTGEDQDAAEGRQEQEVEAEGGEKPRRRRSRRRRDPSKEVAADSPTAEAALDEIVDESDDDSIDINGEEDFDSDETESGTTKKRPSHRNIPTWAEATGVIIESNLQQRSKSPSKAKSGSARGRGRGRGGRRKKS